MRARCKSLVVAAVTAACTIACGGTTSSGGSNALTACDDFFNAISTNPCLMNSGLALPIGPDYYARARMRWEPLCAKLLALPGQGAGAAWLEQCAHAAQGNAFCRGGEQSIAACNGGTAGTLPDGSACASGSQCQSTQCFPDSSPQGCGHCRPQMGPPPPPQTYGAAGGQCPCQDGLYCNAMTGTCAPLATSGGSCSSSDGCDWPLYCGSGTCKPALNAGDACAPSDVCSPGLYCDATAHCVAPQWAMPGATCGANVTCEIGQCFHGTCPTIIPDGQPCGPDPTKMCDVYADCMGGTCQLQTPPTCQ
jgi:hypothetical protein